MQRCHTLLVMLVTSLFLTGTWAAAPSADSTTGGFEMSVTEGTQLNYGPLGIGLGFVGVGTYLDEKNVKQYGLHASLSIAIEGQPSLFQQPDVREGQTLSVAGYRILVEKIIPGEKGVVVLRLWSAAKTA